MPALPIRRIASSALCTTLLLGIAAPTALGADSDTRRGRSDATAPIPNADVLLTQSRALDNLGGVLEPTTDLVQHVLKADYGQLTVAEATQLANSVKEGFAQFAPPVPTAPSPVFLTPPATSTTPPAPISAMPTTPLAPAAPSTDTTATKPATEGTPPAAALPADPMHQSRPNPLFVLGGSVAYSKGGTGRAGAPADLKAEALADLKKSIDTLLKATTSGDPNKVGPAVNDVLTSTVNLVAATLAGSGLPAPTLPGLQRQTGGLPTS